MTPTNAFISLDEIVMSYMLKSGMSIHNYYILAKLAAESVRELALSYLPMVNHVILEKEDKESWFVIPDDYTNYVSVGLVVGERWRPVAVSNSLLPMPNNDLGGEYDTSHSSEFDTQGGYTNWLNPDYATIVGSFNPGDFGEGFQTQDYSMGEAATVPASVGWAYPYNLALWNTEHYNDFWESKGRYFGGTTGVRPDSVQFNVEKGLIMCPSNFPANKLYLVYTGIGNVDTMSRIPVLAQSAIEARMEWQYHSRKRNISRGQVADYERLYYIEERKMMRRIDTFNLTEMRRILAKNFKRSKA